MSGNKSVKYDSLGYDKDGFNSKGYNKDGYDKNGYNDRGWNKVGRNRLGLYVGDWECCGNPGLKGKENPNPKRHLVKGRNLSLLGDVICNEHAHAPCYPDPGGCIKLDDAGKKRPKEEVTLRVVISI